MDHDGESSQKQKNRNKTTKKPVEGKEEGLQKQRWLILYFILLIFLHMFPSFSPIILVKFSVFLRVIKERANICFGISYEGAE